jgi:hypothetical protein
MAPKVWAEEEVLLAADLNVVAAQAYNALKPSGNLAGLTNLATARANLGLTAGAAALAALGLGNAALLNVGTGSGQVAAGDDPRFAGLEPISGTVTATGGSINNVTVGGTTAATGRFTTLESTGTATLGSASTNYFTAAGSASYPTIQAAGASTDIDAKVLGKGLGYLNTTKLFVGEPGVRAVIDTRSTVYLRTSTTYTGGNPYSLFAGGIYSGTGSGDVQLMSFLADDTITNGSTMFRVHHNLGTNAGGAHTALSAGLTIASPVDAGAGSNFQVALGSIIRVTATNGGIPGNPKGNNFAGNDIAVAGNGAGGHVFSLIGREASTTISGRVGVEYHIGISSVLHYDITGGNLHEARGWVQDTAFLIGSARNDLATVGWRIGLGVGNPTGWVFDADSRLIATEPVTAAFASSSRDYELADVIDMTGLSAINRAFYIMNGASLDGNGNSGAQVAAGVSLQTRSAINAKTAVVATVTPLLPDGGGLYSASGVPTVAIDAPPGSGTTATATIATHAAQEILSMTNGGTGYSVDQILTQSGGTGTAATVRVLRVDGDGKIRELTVETGGDYSVLPSGEQSFTGGTGTGLSCALLYTALTIDAGGVGITNPGSNYPEFPAPVARFTGGTVFRPAVLVVTMTASAAVLQLNAGKINVAGIPTSSAGLATGDLWNDGGTLKVAA